MTAFRYMPEIGGLEVRQGCYNVVRQMFVCENCDQVQTQMQAEIALGLLPSPIHAWLPWFLCAGISQICPWWHGAQLYTLLSQRLQQSREGGALQVYDEVHKR